MGLRLERADPVGGTPRSGVGMMRPVGPQTALLWDREQLRAQGSGWWVGDLGWVASERASWRWTQGWGF